MVDCMRFGVYDVDSEECGECSVYELCKCVTKNRRLEKWK